MKITLWALVIALLALAPPALAAPGIGHFRVAIDTAATNADYSATPGRNNVVILQQYQVDRMRQLKAANPRLKVLMYKNLVGMTERQPSGFVSGGVATQEAAPDWYLLNTAGSRFTSRYFNWIWIADVGNRAYQQRWADNVLGEVQRDGWDGVFMDDVNPTLSWHYDVKRIAKYPSDAAWQTATRSALSTVGARFRAADKLVIANFSNSKSFPKVIADWFKLVDGGLNEQFLKWGTTTSSADSYDPVDYWELQLAQLKQAEADGKYYLGLMPSPASDRDAARYGFATTLLAGRSWAQFGLHSDYTNERWFQEYDYAIGTPAGEETSDASGVHRRRFSNGLVYVNPTARAVRVEFGGRYTGSGLQDATGATLPPRSGLILAKAGEGAPFRLPISGPVLPQQPADPGPKLPVDRGPRAPGDRSPQAPQGPDGGQAPSAGGVSTGAPSPITGPPVAPLINIGKAVTATHRPSRVSSANR